VNRRPVALSAQGAAAVRPPGPECRPALAPNRRSPRRCGPSTRPPPRLSGREPRQGLREKIESDPRQPTLHRYRSGAWLQVDGRLKTVGRLLAGHWPPGQAPFAGCAYTKLLGQTLRVFRNPKGLKEGGRNHEAQIDVSWPIYRLALLIPLVCPLSLPSPPSPIRTPAQSKAEIRTRYHVDQRWVDSRPASPGPHPQHGRRT